MPDFILLAVALICVLGCIAAFCAAFAEPPEAAYLLLAIVFAVVGFFDIKWWVHAYDDWHDNNVSSVVASFEIQTMTNADGSQYQIYYDYKALKIINITSRWNKFVPEGTMVLRYERQNKWGGGVRFFLPDYTYDELLGPLDDRWDGPPNERIENGN